MDSLIRLEDLPMPIAPLTDSNINNIDITTADNDFNINLNPQHTVLDGNTTHLDEMPELIDLTTSKVDDGSPPSLDNAHTFSLSCQPIVFVNEENCGFSGANRSPRKRKVLPPSNHSPSKVCRTDHNNCLMTLIDLNENSSSSSRTQERIRPLTMPISNMGNHTITSVSRPNGLQFDHVATNTAGPSGENNCLGPYSNRVNAPEYIPGRILADEEPNNYHNNVLKTHNVDFDIAKEETKHIQPKPLQINDKLGHTQNNGKESAMFYQLLDMFPDIDLKYLERLCRLGLPINQVSEIILEMNDYPKVNFPESDWRLQTIEPVDVNNFINTTHTTVADKDVKLVSEEIKNDNPSQIVVPATTNAVCSTSTYLNCDPTTSQTSGNGICDIKSTGSPASNDSQKASKNVLADKHRQDELVRKEKTNLHDENSFTNSTENQFGFLMEIFPDADPTFMKNKSKLKDDDLRKFIAESMENNNYPKITASVIHDKEVQDEPLETELYTTNFNLTNFIKIFPDPFGYFLDEQRNCQYTEHGVGFLKRRYRYHAIKLILSKYSEFKFNLVKTCDFLDAEKPTRVSKRGRNEIKMPEGVNLPFLQEACFIEHKIAIKDYLDGVAEAKRLTYEQAEARGELIECGCCFQNVLFEDCATCNEGHLFCKTCVQKSVEVRIGDGQTTFPCLQECDSVFSLQLLEALVNATMFSRLLQRIQLDEVRAADIEGLEDCPFCDFAIILPPETSIFKCLNPECLKESCRKCHRLSHIPKRCEELENDEQARARKYIEDEMTKALVRVCYKCKKSFIKIDGCNKMTCTCGAKMCYICRQPNIDYKHFNGPGGEEKKKCPLYSTDKVLHVDAVEAMAKKALEEVTTRNPELKLKHDPSKILPPADKAKTTLPPGAIEDPNILLNVLQNVRQIIEPIPQVRNVNVSPDLIRLRHQLRQVQNHQHNNQH